MEDILAKIKEIIAKLVDFVKNLVAKFSAKGGEEDESKE